MRVYVDELPKAAENCPFYGKSNKKCAMTNEKCCYEKDKDCGHLLTLVFGEPEEYIIEEENSNGI